MWLVARDELAGRPYWLISLAGIAVACAVRGRPDAAPAWGIAAILAGGLQFLYSAGQTRLILVLVLAFLGLSGLPYTPLASGMQGIVVLPFNVLDVALMIVFSLLLVGYARHSAAERAPLKGMDRWVQVVYPLGLFWLVLSFWLVGFFGWQGSLTMGQWWVSMICVLLAVGLFLLIRLEKPALSDQWRLGWVVTLFKPLGKTLAAIVRLEWLYPLITLVFRLIQGIVHFLTALLEGEGGLLWTLLLTILLISILSSGSSP